MISAVFKILSGKQENNYSFFPLKPELEGKQWIIM